MQSDNLKSARNQNNRRKCAGKMRISLCLALTSLILAVSIGAQTAGDRDAYQEVLARVKAGHFEQAVPALEAMLRVEPGNLKVRNLLGLALTGAGRLRDADREFSKLLESDPNFVPALKNLGINEYHLKQTDAARLHLQRALSSTPRDPIASLYLGEIFASQHECLEANQHYQAAGERLHIEPGFVLHAAECLLQTHETSLAVNLLATLAADAAKPQFEAGVLLGRTANYAASAGHFEEAQREPSLYELAGYNRVLMLVKQQLYIDAANAANAMIRQGHDTAELDSLLAEAYRGAGRMEDAYNALRRATHLSPGSDSSYAELADLCRELGRYDLGLTIIDIGLRHVPRSSKLYTQRGLLQMALGHTSASVADLQTAKELAPGDTAPSLALGVLSMQTGQNQQAIQLLKREASSHPDDFALWYLLAKALVRSGGGTPGARKEANTALQRSIQLNGEFAPSRVALANLLLDAGKTRNAIEELETSIRIDPNNQSGLYKLALAYRRAGNLEKARKLGARVRDMNAAELEKASLDPSLLHSRQQQEIKTNVSLAASTVQ